MFSVPFVNRMSRSTIRLSSYLPDLIDSGFNSLARFIMKSPMTGVPDKATVMNGTLIEHKTGKGHMKMKYHIFLIEWHKYMIP